MAPLLDFKKVHVWPTRVTYPKALKLTCSHAFRDPRHAQAHGMLALLPDVRRRVELRRGQALQDQWYAPPVATAAVPRPALVLSQGDGCQVRTPAHAHACHHRHTYTV